MLSTDVLHDVQVFSILAAIMHVIQCAVHKVALDAHSNFMTHHALDTIHIIIFQRLLDALT